MTKYGYSLSRNYSQNKQYAHVEIRIKEIGGSRWDHLLQVRYQNDRKYVGAAQPDPDNGHVFVSNGYEYHNYWYAGKFEANRFGYRAEFKEIARLYYRIDTRLAKNGVNLYNDPAGLIQALEELGIKRYEWDPRLDREVLIEDLKGLEYSSWRDDHGVGMYGIAVDEDGAVASVDARFRAYVDEHSWAASRYDTWVNDGRPVKRDDRRVLYEHNWPKSQEDILALEW